MRIVFLASALAAALATPALAADKPAVDLVASFVLGIEDGSIAGSVGEPGTSSMKQTGPGVFEGIAITGPAFSFAVADKGDCSFEIAYKIKDQFIAAIAVDAKKLKSVTYEQTGEQDGLFDYKINMRGAPDIVSLVDAKGVHTATDQNSTLSTSLTADHMQEAVTSFQATYCPAAP